MTEYVVLILGDADRWWTSMSLKERVNGYAEYSRFQAELIKRGHQIIGGAELHPSSRTRTIQPGGEVVTDGPFAETAEQVGGFYQVRTEDPDDLIDCARIIAALGDAVEVRPAVDPSERPS